VGGLLFKKTLVYVLPTSVGATLCGASRSPVQIPARAHGTNDEANSLHHPARSHFHASWWVLQDSWPIPAKAGIQTVSPGFRI